MKVATLFMAGLAPFAVVGLTGSYYGHLVVLVLTLGIFFGTLSLGKTQAGAAPNRFLRG